MVSAYKAQKVIVYYAHIILNNRRTMHTTPTIDDHFHDEVWRTCPYNARITRWIHKYDETIDGVDYRFYACKSTLDSCAGTEQVPKKPCYQTVKHFEG